jgi:hypothetical protein
MRCKLTLLVLLDPALNQLSDNRLLLCMYHDCNLPKSRFRLMERGRDAKGWLAGLTINAPQ